METLATKYAFTEPHRNVCVRLRDGRATIQAPGMPDYEIWYAPPHVDIAVTERDDALEVFTATPSTSTSTSSPGTVCLGIATPDP